MSENTADYNKKTCIICGCHTNQTINIYEPRSGPNIVQLIQARFKFQPLNDDKYLCYSCNNWLINWHSLQAANSDNADNSGGNFRRNLNNSKPEMSIPLDVELKRFKCSKPIAIVKPRVREQPYQPPNDETFVTSDKSGKYDYSEVGRLSLQQQRKLRSRSSVWGKSSVISPSTTVVSKCEICRHINTSPVINSDTNHQSRYKSSTPKNNLCNLVSKTPCKGSGNIEETSPPITLPYLPRKTQAASIDGKVVSMLRRIGTTLSRDLQSTSGKCEPLAGTFMKKPQAMRQAPVDDEILINFNTAISEVLYYNEKRSTFDVINRPSNTIIISSDDEYEQDIREDSINLCEVSNELNLERVFSLVPKGISVSLISDTC